MARAAPVPISGRRVAITGAARGIGRATAASLVREGATVAIGDLDAETARDTAAALGERCHAFELDVTDRESFAAFLDAAEAQIGPLDAFINNAGICHLGPFIEEDDAATERQLDINLRGVITGTRLALERFRARRAGHLINVASSAGKLSPPGIATYAATKHAVVGLTEAVRAENRDMGIEFSIVMPGVVNTDMALGYEKGRWVKFIDPEDVAEAIVATLRRPRRDVYVPRSVGALNKMLTLLPLGAQEALGRALKVDQIIWNADMAARASYEARAAASDPKLAERTSA
jgi:NAD(P)-dependent dehydrogenase (short-subunit alcohol dehydrogenase family)